MEGLEPIVVLGRIIAPAMHHIGELWQRGAITVADEHLATGISHAALARLHSHLMADAPRTGRTALLAAVQGEEHVMGLRMAADILEGAGWETLYLGPGVPIGALGAAAGARRPDLVCITATMPLGAAALEWSVAAVQQAHSQARIILGGQGIPPRLRDELPYAATIEELPGLAAATAGEGPSRWILPRHPRPASCGGATTGSREERLAEAAADAAEVARSQARLARDFRRLAFEDPLTGLPNRRAFDDRFSELVRGALILVDVDDFGSVNDLRGHEAGDRVLQAVAGAIARSVRARDFPARLGGDEFAVLVPGLGVDEAASIAERIRSAVAATGVTVSVGVSLAGPERRASKLAADEALYAAKAAGRDAVCTAEGDEGVRVDVEVAGRR